MMPTPAQTARWRAWTVRILAGGFVGGCLLDLAAYHFGGNEATISRVLIENSRVHPVIPLVIGGLVVHVYARMAARRAIRIKIPARGSPPMASPDPTIHPLYDGPTDRVPAPEPKTFVEKLLAIGVAGRTKGGAWSLVPSDWTKAGVTLATVGTVAYGVLSAVATYAPQVADLVRQLGFPKTAAALLAIGGATVKLVALWAQGQSIVLDPADPTRHVETAPVEPKGGG